MAESDLFEKMFASYPAQKRELARAVYHRFADGDSTQFFSQLFLVLDVYAHYAEHIPARMISANADTVATVGNTQRGVGFTSADDFVVAVEQLLNATVHTAEQSSQQRIDFASWLSITGTRAGAIWTKR
ncbi:MAG: hypothetical protein ACREFR_10525 [Limisphaerales bacterium]